MSTVAPLHLPSNYSPPDCFIIDYDFTTPINSYARISLVRVSDHAQIPVIFDDSVEAPPLNEILARFPSPLSQNETATTDQI
jgi:hypothetical protein